MSKELHIFDFDGTITFRDSLPHFIQYAVGKPQYYLGLLRLSPMLLRYKLGIIANDIAKEKLISYFFKGWDSNAFSKLADRYSSNEIRKIVRSSAMERIAKCRQEKHSVVIVSASMESWLKQWSQLNQLDLISTQLEVMDGHLTGKFLTKNCYGQEKVNRVKEKYDLGAFDVIHAYGDSKGDREMLQMADYAHYRLFK